jgi:hypothetical protein
MVVPLRSIVKFVSNLKKYWFKRCRTYFQNFNIIGAVARELHLLKLMGVEIFFIFQIWSKHFLLLKHNF